MEIIGMNNLSKSFGHLKVLNCISLTYEQGKIYGLAGENGAGKTTLFRCLTGILPYEGTIRKGKEVKVGYLPAECYFYSLITGREYIEFCLKAYGEQLSRTRLDEIRRGIPLALRPLCISIFYRHEKETGVLGSLSATSRRIYFRRTFQRSRPKRMYLIEKPDKAHQRAAENGHRLFAPACIATRIMRCHSLFM